MSVRTDVMDVRSRIKYLIDKMEEVDFAYGDYFSDVESALQVLVQQIDQAADSIEAAFLRSQIDLAEETRRRAEERIAELGKAADR